MSWLDKASRVLISNFKGPNYLMDEEDIRNPEGLDAQNVEYLEGQVRTRRGFVQSWNPARAISKLYNWFTSQRNHLIYFTPSPTPTAVSRNLATDVETDLVLYTSLGTAPVGMSAAQAGPRIYMAFYDSTGEGTTDAYVTSILSIGVTSEASLTTVCFQRPFTTDELSATLAEDNTGSVTAGTHYFGLIFTSKSGYTLAPSPTSSETFTPWSIVSDGSHNVKIIVTPTTAWPDWCSASGLSTTNVQLIMSPVDNTSVFYKIPASQGGVMSVPAGSVLPITFTIDIEDDILREGTEVVDEFNYLHQTASSTPPFKPFKVLEYNNRIAYLTNYTDGYGGVTGSAFISDAYAAQNLTLARNLIQLPGFRSIKSGFVLGGALHLCGPSWTYAYNDSTGPPLEWAAPQLVSGAIGSPFPDGTYSNPATGWGWVCDTKGLYPFNGGSFPDRPASYLVQPVWDRINWAAPASCLQIVENVARREVIVMAPLDGATTATHFLVWDWTEGRTYDRIRFCGLWSISLHTPGSVAIVKNATTNVDELWTGAGVAGKVLRQRYVPEDTDDSTIYSDDGQGIDSYYEVGSAAGVQAGPSMHLGAHFRVRGNGDMQVSVKSLGGVREHDLAPITLSDPVSSNALRTYELQSEAVSYKVSNGAAAGAYFILSAIWHYWRRWLDIR